MTKTAKMAVDDEDGGKNKKNKKKQKKQKKQKKFKIFLLKIIFFLINLICSIYVYTEFLPQYLSHNLCASITGIIIFISNSVTIDNISYMLSIFL